MARLLVPAPEPTPEVDEFAEPRQVMQRIIDQWLEPDERDKQRKIGPSGIGDPCDYCVAQQLSVMLPGTVLPKQKANLSTRIGTAIHFDLEHTIVGDYWDSIGFRREMPKVLCGEIEGYGEIRGTIDAYIESIGLVCDYKGSKKELVKKYRVQGVPTAYSYQRQVYGRGIQLLGKKIEYVGNIFFPRDSFFPEDIFIDVERYDPLFAEEAFARASVIWRDYVLPGRIGDLASDDDCFTCTRYASNKVTGLVFKADDN